jgi:hypothetical protein
LNKAARKTPSWGTARSETEIAQIPIKAQKETPIIAFRSMEFSTTGAAEQNK